MRYQAALRPEGRNYTRYRRITVQRPDALLAPAMPGDPLIDTYIVEA